MTTREKVQLILTATANGKPCNVPSNAQWSSSDESVVTLEVDDGGLSAWAVSAGPGDVTITVTTNGPTASIDLSVIAVADTLIINAGDPVLK